MSLDAGSGREGEVILFKSGQGRQPYTLPSSSSLQDFPFSGGISGNWPLIWASIASVGIYEVPVEVTPLKSITNSKRGKYVG